MPKESGVGIDALYVGGYDLSGDTGAVQTIAQRRAAQIVTGLDKAAEERIPLRNDGEISFNSWFNPSAAQEHPVLSALPTTDITVLYFHGSTPGVSPAAGLVAKQIDYQMAYAADGSLALTTQALSNGTALEWGEMLSAGKQLFASSGAGTAFDTGGSLSFGAVAYLQVFSLSGTSVTVAVQDSVDSTPANFSDITGMAFTAVTAAAGHGQQRLATTTTATIRRWVRINTTGTFTNASIAVLFRKFEVAQS